MHDLYRLKDSLVDQLREYGTKDLSESSLKTIDTLAHATKNVMKVIEGCEKDGYSERYPKMNDGTGYYVRPDGSYARGRGRGAKRDSMGRYSSAEDEVVSNLERLMETATDEHTRKEIQKLIDRM